MHFLLWKRQSYTYSLSYIHKLSAYKSKSWPCMMILWSQAATLVIILWSLMFCLMFKETICHNVKGWQYLQKVTFSFVSIIIIKYLKSFQHLNLQSDLFWQYICLTWSAVPQLESWHSVEKLAGGGTLRWHNLTFRGVGEGSIRLPTFLDNRTIFRISIDGIINV